jgi:predicted ester cyclase
LGKGVEVELRSIGDNDRTARACDHASDHLSFFQEGRRKAIPRRQARWSRRCARHDYIACLNKQDWPNLGRFVHEEVYYNGEGIGLSGYREMLEGDFRAIPDLYFDIHLLISEPPRVASRLRFDCTPKGILFGLHVNGKRVSFTENVFYEFRDGQIEQVWSVIDKAAIESQLS